MRAGDLVPHDMNYRTHPEAQRAVMKAIYKDVGFARSLLAYELPDGRLKLVDGHLRQEMTPDLEVTVEVLDLTEAEAKLLLATLDPVAAMATADKAKLEDLLKQVQSNDDAVTALLAELAASAGLEYGRPTDDPTGGGDDFDVDAAAEGPCRVAKGDLWLIDGGKHRLLCGDSTKADDVARLMNGEKAGLCFTSPPYAQQRDYGQKITDWDGLMQGVFANLPMTDDGQVLVNLGLVHKDGEWWPYWDEWIEWMRTQGWRRFGWYVWDQGFGLPGDWNGRLAPSHEFLWHFNRTPKRPEKWIRKNEENIKVRRHGESTMRDQNGKLQSFTSPEASGQPNKIPDSTIRVNRQVGAIGDGLDHPAPYPIGLPLFVQQSWTGDIYDPFLGSGTSIIAASRLSRRCFGLEIEPKYCEVILKRCEAEGLSVEKEQAPAQSVKKPKKKSKEAAPAT